MAIPAKAVKLTPNDRGTYANLTNLYLAQAPAGGTGGVEANRDFGYVNVRFADGTTQQLYFDDAGYGPTELGLEIIQVLEDDSDVGTDGMALDGTTARAGAIYAGNWLWGVFSNDTTLLADRAPVFTNSSFEVTVNHSQATFDVFTVETDDADYDDITIAEQGTWDTQFSLDTTSGVISFTRNAGLTAGTTYSLVVRATANSLTTDATFMVHVRPNRAPAFDNADHDGTHKSLYRLSDSVASLFDASASDADGDAITYSTQGTWDSHFALDTTTGVISYTKGAALTPDSTYELTVRASDGTDNTDQTFYVYVHPNRAPWFEETDYGADHVARLARLAASVSQLFKFTARDADPGDELTWAEVGTWNTRFSLDTTTGVISYTQGTAMTAGSLIELPMTLSDGLVTISLTPHVYVYANREPRFTNTAAQRTTTIARNAASDASLLDANAVDPDGDTLTYAEVGTWDTRFGITAGTGVIAYTKGAEFTPEEEIELVVSASDGELTVEETFTVLIHENRAPRFTNTSNILSIATTQAASQTLWQIGTSDADGDTVTVSLDSSSNSAFGYDASTGYITYDGSLTLSVNDGFSLTLTASDGDLTHSEVFAINVTS